MLPFRHKLLANYERNVGYREELDDEFAPFSRAAAAAGYQLGHVGKWHVGREHGPADFGFEGEHYPGLGKRGASTRTTCATSRARGFRAYRLRSEVRGTFPNGEPGNLLAGVLDQPVEATFEYFLAERAIERMRTYAGYGDGRPFYLRLHWFGPHLPYCLPEELLPPYDPADVELPASMAETFADKPLVQRHYSGALDVRQLRPPTTGAS